MQHKTSKSWPPVFVRTSWLQMAAGFLRGNLELVEEAKEGLPLLWMTSSHPARKGLLSAALSSQAMTVILYPTPMLCFWGSLLSEAAGSLGNRKICMYVRGLQLEGKFYLDY